MSDFDQAKQPVRSDGVYVPGQNDVPSSQAIVGHVPNAAPTGNDATKRITAVTGASNRTGLHAALLDEAGNPYTPTNPLYVATVDGEGPNANDYKPDTVSKNNGTATHTFSPTGAFRVREISVCSVLEGKFEFKLNGATKDVAFVTPASPNAKMTFPIPFTVTVGDSLTVVKTNRDKNFDTDMYSIIKGEYDV